MANHYHKRYPRLVYCDDMSPVEADLLLASIASLEACFANTPLGSGHGDGSIASSAGTSPAEKEIAAAIVEQSLDYFNRHIAGDR
jgi:hypothetical protein